MSFAIGYKESLLVPAMLGNSYFLATFESNLKLDSFSETAVNVLFYSFSSDMIRQMDEK